MQFYIDPGTGSMLFTILIGLISAGLYALKGTLIKLKYKLGGGKGEEDSNKVIPYVIFSDDKRYWNVFRSVCEEFNKREIPMTYLTISEDDPAFDSGYEYLKCEYIGSGNKAFARLNHLKADVLYATTPSLDVYQWKRSPDVKWYVHIMHAPKDITMYRMFGIDYFDAILVSSEVQKKQVRQLEEIRNLPAKEIEFVGVPQLDEMKLRLDAEGLNSHEGINVLLAPSWGASSIFNRFGTQFIDRLIDTGYHIIIRPHPQSFTSEKELIDGLMSKYPDGEQVEWNSDRDNFDVLNRSDILISDFSGVFFDFCFVFDKPIIYTDTSFDKSPYDACWIDEELWTFEVLPDLGVKLDESNMDRIREVIDTCLHDQKYKEGRDRARSGMWTYIGEAGKRTADYLIAKREELVNERAQKDEAE